MAYWEKDISSGFVRIVEPVLTVHRVVSNDRMDLHSTNEAALSFDDAEEQDSDRDTNCCIDTILDTGKNSHKDTGKEDDDFQRVDAPELINGVWGRDQVSDCVDDDR